jgi:hypothetical protein
MKVGDLFLVSGGQLSPSSPVLFYLAEVLETGKDLCQIELLASTGGRWSGADILWIGRNVLHPMSELFTRVIPQQRWAAREIISSYFNWR